MTTPTDLSHYSLEELHDAYLTLCRDMADRLGLDWQAPADVADLLAEGDRLARLTLAAS